VGDLVLSVGALFLGLGDSNLVCLVHLSPVFSYYRCYKPKDARAPILIIEVQVRPVKIVHYCQRSHRSVYEENTL